MKKIAFLTSYNFDEVISQAAGKFSDEFALLKPLFNARGVEFDKVTWDSKTDWSQYSALLIKAAWDYVEKQKEFRSFLEHAKKSNLHLINSAEVALWNLDKSYLLDFVKADLPVAPLTFVHNENELTEEFFQQQPERLILKPSYSAGSYNTALIERKNWKNHLELMKKIIRESTLIVQPFIEEIAQGEYSFFYFGGEFSHGVKKTPSKNDFRAHSHYGCVNETYSPTLKEISEVYRFVQATPAPVNYARVDLVKKDEQLLLIELELIEPYLYLEYAPDPGAAARRFVDCVVTNCP